MVLVWILVTAAWQNIFVHREDGLLSALASPLSQREERISVLTIVDVKQRNVEIKRKKKKACKNVNASQTAWKFKSSTYLPNSKIHTISKQNI